MSDIKHTKGPWVKCRNVGVYGDSFYITGTYNNKEVVICEYIRTVQDLHLISAAPDLLEALESVFLRLTFEHTTDWREERRILGEIVGLAINKAQGKK